MPLLSSLPLSLLGKIGGILIIVGFIWYKYNSLNNTIEQLELEKKELTNEMNKVQLEVLMEKNNVLTLQNGISEANELVVSLQNKNIDIAMELDKLKRMPRNKEIEKIIVDYGKSNKTCTDLEALIMRIAKLKYKDL